MKTVFLISCETVLTDWILEMYCFTKNILFYLQVILLKVFSWFLPSGTSGKPWEPLKKLPTSTIGWKWAFKSHNTLRVVVCARQRCQHITCQQSFFPQPLHLFLLFCFVASLIQKGETKQSWFFSIGSSQVITFFPTGNIKLQAAWKVLGGHYFSLCGTPHLKAYWNLNPKNFNNLRIANRRLA